MTYAEKLQNPKWQKKRLEIFQRDEFRCQLCDDDASTLIVHHKRYVSGVEPWEYDNKMLITLCLKCHHKVHPEKLRQLYASAVPVITEKTKVLIKEIKPKVISEPFNPNTSLGALSKIRQQVLSRANGGNHE